MDVLSARALLAQLIVARGTTRFDSAQTLDHAPADVVRPVESVRRDLSSPTHTYVTDALDLQRTVDHMSGLSLIGLDLETEGLDPHAHRIRLVTLSMEVPLPDSSGVGVTIVIVDTWQCDSWVEILRPVLANPRILKVLHHGKFDLQFLLAADLEVHGPFDTMLAAQLLDGGNHLQTKGYFTLASVAGRELGADLDKAQQQSDWTRDELSDEQLRYAATDAGVLLPLYRALAKKLTMKRLDDAAALEFEALPALAWLELSGAPFALDKWVSLSDAAMARKLALEEELAELFAAPQAGAPAGGSRINVNSPKQVREALAVHGITVSSTAEDVLAPLAQQHPLVARLLAYREADKLAKTYGITFIKHVHARTGRIHARYHQIGTATGRMSCAGPNLQQVPGILAYRACFRPASTRVLVKADLSMVELCVAADISGDTHMIEAIDEGRDLHRITAAALFGKPPEAVTREERGFGKAVNFGTLYGQGIRGLRELAGRHGLDLSEDDAHEFQRRFAGAWPQLAAWQRRQMRGSGTLIRTAAGRYRRLGPDAPGTVRVNTPVQGTAADGFKAALANLWQTRHEHPTAVPVLAVHDELVVECDAADAEQVCAWVTACLQDGMRRYVTKVPVRVEVQVAPTWAGTLEPTS